MKIKMPYRYYIDIQNPRAGYFKGGNVTILAENGRLRQNLADGGSHVTRGLYKTSSGAACPFLSFPFL